MAANDNSDDAGGVATINTDSDTQALLDRMREDTLQALRLQNGPAPTSVFIGANGRGLTNDAARLMAGRQNRFNADPSIVYSAELHGDPDLPNAWAMVGRKLAQPDDTDPRDQDDINAAPATNPNRDAPQATGARLSLGRSGVRQTGVIVKPDGTRVMVLDGTMPASSSKQPQGTAAQGNSDNSKRDTTPAQGLQVDPPTGLASFAYTSKAMKQAEDSLAGKLAAGVGGTAESFINMGLGTAAIAKNTMVQALDAATLGANHDAPLAQQAWAEQAALGNALYHAATNPREAFDKLMQGLAKRYDAAMALENERDRTYALAKLFNDTGQAALGAGAMARGGLAKYRAMQDEAQAAAEASELRRQATIDNNFGADSGYDPHKINYFAVPGGVGRVTDFSHPYLYTGHVGYSFNNGTNIYGLGPYAPELVREPTNFVGALRDGKVFPGFVTDDRPFFERALSSEAQARGGLGKQDVYKLDVPVTRPQFERAQQLTAERGLEVPLEEFPYAFKTGGADTAPYNCATYPSSLGLPIPENSGAMLTVIPKIIKEGATRWRPTR